MAGELADWLLEEQLLSPEQVHSALLRQRETTQPLAFILLDLGMLDEPQLVDLLARRHNMPAAPRRLYKLSVPSKALSAVPQDVCWQHGLFPFAIERGTCHVAMVDPANIEAHAALLQLHLEARFFVAGPRQLEKAIRKHYLDSWIDESGVAQRRRFFGYEAITDPGLGSRFGTGTEWPKLENKPPMPTGGHGDLLAQELNAPTPAPEPALDAVPSHEAENDSGPVHAGLALARIKRGHDVEQLTRRIETLENTIHGLLAAIAKSKPDPELRAHVNAVIAGLAGIGEDVSD